MRTERTGVLAMALSGQLVAPSRIVGFTVPQRAAIPCCIKYIQVKDGHPNE